MQQQIEKSSRWVWAFMPLSVLYLEVILRIVVGEFWNWGLLLMPLFSLALGTFLALFCALGSPKANRIVGTVILAVLWVLFSVQLIYHRSFSKFLILYSLGAGGVDQITDAGVFRSTAIAIAEHLWAILLFLLPALLFFFISKKHPLQKAGIKTRIWVGIGALLFYVAVMGTSYLLPSVRRVATDVFDANRAVPLYGLIRTELMDIRCNLLGLQWVRMEKEESETPTDAPALPPPEAAPQYNMLEIDFSALAETEKDADIKELHEYFGEIEPTEKNEYTGMFEGYNLILVTAEGFSPYCIDKQLTPTLYKMYNEGFQFTDFYTPIWGVSTSDGEYVATTGLIPKAGVWSYYRSGKQGNAFPFSMGHQFLKSGLPTVYAYHPHSYSYYHRDISHPNMGYNYKGYGNGLEDYITKQWPESDLEMVEATADEFITADAPFHAYYMTVSGHMEYSFNDNMMSYKNRDKVAHLTCSEAVKAYYACNIELDRAMEKLLEKLNAAGVADKTVIAISPDHYPYGLEDKEAENIYHYFDEMAGHSVETNFELYKGAFLLYCQGMEGPIVVDKTASSMDIIPTLNNLFGFSYDSRLLMGRDILSDADPLVVFLNRSWITDKGRYNADTKEFEPFIEMDGAQKEAYVEQINVAVSNQFKASALILETDYYGIVVPNEK